MIEIDFDRILLKRIEEDFEKERKKITEHSDDLKSLLIKIGKAGRWSLPTSVMGTDTHHPELEKGLDLLERSGLIRSKAVYTKHNAYQEYSLAEKGKAMVQQFAGHA